MSLRRKMFKHAVPLAAFCMLTGVAASVPGVPDRFGAVSLERLNNAASEPGEWFTGGRDGQGSYYSPLDQINSGNIGELGFAWEYRTNTKRGLEATPIVVDGIMYTSGNGGLVYALDARSGKELWTFDPENNPQAARYACCDTVNRGVAVRDGLVYVASLDGRLFALDAATGKTRWSADTIIDHNMPYTITGAPQLTRDLVVIGNGGADMGKGGVRGYVSAYDLKTGKFRWRFYTVPKLGEKHPTPDMAEAERTWDPARSPEVQGGGTVWDGMAYDPELDLLYIGVGNSAPWPVRDRSPNGGDNLYLSSIVAINPNTGQRVWHYQTTPGDIWDYTATQKMILADLTIDGKPRKVIMQAPKNGYFYVLDRATGKVISAKPYIHINWSSGMDRNFRPIVTPQADYSKEPKLIYPSWTGGHDWQPMSFSPRTGLVYIPVYESPMLAVDLKNQKDAAVKHIDGSFGTMMIIPEKIYAAGDFEPLVGKLPKLDPIDPKTGKPLLRTSIKAWNPVTQEQAWIQPVSDGYFSLEGGVTSTAGNLVFQGTASGELRVYAADSGKLLRRIDTGTAILGAPSTYVIDGVQYVAVMAGYGGTAIFSPFPPGSAPTRYENDGRILVFRLGTGKDVPLPDARVARPWPTPPARKGTPADIEAGGLLFTANCARCHAYGTGIVPDLRRMEDGIDDVEFFKQIVLGGLLQPNGMGRFDDILSPGQAEQIHAFLIDQSHAAYDAERAAAAGH
ncbi:MAG: PQQ-dependent dehydrogenase, methanol/ethanol family [Sphingobium sp.]